MQEILTLEAGLNRLIRELVSQGHSLINIHNLNERRYKLIHTDKIKALVMYKKERFFKFGEMFK